MEAPELHITNSARKSCVTDVLRNWQIDVIIPKTEDVLAIMLSHALLV